MADQWKLYLFGDQTHDIKPQLKRLLQNKSTPVVEDFLTRAYDAIRAEIYGLPRETRESLPRFTCLDDLVQWDVGAEGEGRCVALDMAVTCMYQLGAFIRYVPFSIFGPGDILLPYSGVAHSCFGPCAVTPLFLWLLPPTLSLTLNLTIPPFTSLLLQPTHNGVTTDS